MVRQHYPIHCMHAFPMFCGIHHRFSITSQTSFLQKLHNHHTLPGSLLGLKEDKRYFETICSCPGIAKSEINAVEKAFFKQQAFLRKSQCLLVVPMQAYVTVLSHKRERFSLNFQLNCLAALQQSSFGEGKRGQNTEHRQLSF